MIPVTREAVDRPTIEIIITTHAISIKVIIIISQVVAVAAAPVVIVAVIHVTTSTIIIINHMVIRTRTMPITIKIIIIRIR